MWTIISSAYTALVKDQRTDRLKILLLVFKSISGLRLCTPEYLKELITYKNVSGSRLPSLHTHTYKLSKAEFGFMNYAPPLWNYLPKDVKQSDNVNI